MQHVQVLHDRVARPVFVHASLAPRLQRVEHDGTELAHAILLLSFDLCEQIGESPRVLENPTKLGRIVTSNAHLNLRLLYRTAPPDVASLFSKSTDAMRNAVILDSAVPRLFLCGASVRFVRGGTTSRARRPSFGPSRVPRLAFSVSHPWREGEPSEKAPRNCEERPWSALKRTSRTTPPALGDPPMKHAADIASTSTDAPESPIPTSMLRRSYSCPVYTLKLVRERTVRYRATIGDPTAAATAALQVLAADADREHFVVLFLNTAKELIGAHVAFIGSLNAMGAITVREVFKAAIVANAEAIIVSHCHPSGNTRPSPSDQQTTDRLVEASKIWMASRCGSADSTSATVCVEARRKSRQRSSGLATTTTSVASTRRRSHTSASRLWIARSSDGPKKSRSTFGRIVEIASSLRSWSRG